MGRFPWIVIMAIALALGGCSGSSGSKKTSKSALTAQKKQKKNKKQKKQKKNKPQQKKTVAVKKKAPVPAAKIRTAALQADKGAVFATGTVLADGSGMKVDLIAYKHGTGLDLKAGRQGTSYLPLHRFGTQTFGNLADVPCTAPADSDKNAMISKPEKGQGFTVRANQSDGVWRVRVKATSGGEVKVEYQECE
ncbi:MAG: hypothetical protein ABIK09_02660 [Pseudomonadota bacterium]